MLEEALAFFLGFFSIFSPCVLPLIPIVFGASRMRFLDSLAIFLGMIISLFLLSFISVFLVPFKIVGYVLLFFLAFYLLEERIELFFSRHLASFGLLTKLKLPSFLYGFVIPFFWLPCIMPFLGIAISEAVLSERPFSISVFYTAGIAAAIFLLLLVGRKVNLNFSKLRKPLGLAVFISAIYLTTESLVFQGGV